MENYNLEKLGLTESESLIYQTVLKLGLCTVKEITKECGFHRTNIYDVLDQLRQKGLVNSYKQGKASKYQATSPQNLYELLREKKDFLDTIFPGLTQLHRQENQDIKVEVYKGEEGMKVAMRDTLTCGTLLGFGIKGQLREKLPIFSSQWIRDLVKRKIKYKAIYTLRNPPPIKCEIRYVSEKLSGPVATFIYGDTININIWEPSYVAIIIRSKLVAQMYKKHFDLLWKIAKK